MENKPASLVVVPLERHLAGFPNVGVADRLQGSGNSKASSLQRFDRFLMVGR